MIFKRVKIIATLGPASNGSETLTELIKNGVNVFRINMSHESISGALELISKIRNLAQTNSQEISILADLCGSKTRIGEVPDDINLESGKLIKIKFSNQLCQKDFLSVNSLEVVNSLQKKDKINLGDGALKLRIHEKHDEFVIARVIAGGKLKSHMGFSVYNLSMNSSTTEKDKDDIRNLAGKVDAFAVSFVQSDKEIKDIKKLIGKKEISIIAKIETASAVKNIEKIIKVADGIMIARGDLGLAVSLAEVPYIQKRLINLCLKNAKPVIVATQMLESMIQNSTPTRAEVSDVANAILDGTDAVMLSGETAVGRFPVETTKTMINIVVRADDYVPKRFFNNDYLIANAVSAATVQMTDQIKAKLIIVFTHSGSTARRISRHRTKQPILALSPLNSTVKNLVFSWNVFPIHTKIVKNMDEMISMARSVATDNQILNLKKGDTYIISAGIPFGKSGSTNLILVKTLY